MYFTSRTRRRAVWSDAGLRGEGAQVRCESCSGTAIAATWSEWAPPIQRSSPRPRTLRCNSARAGSGGCFPLAAAAAINARRRLRTVYKEIVIRLAADSSAAKRNRRSFSGAVERQPA